MGDEDLPAELLGCAVLGVILFALAILVIEVVQMVGDGRLP